MLLKALCAHFCRSERCLLKRDVRNQVSHLRVCHLLWCLYLTTLLRRSDSFYLLLYTFWAPKTPLTSLNLNLTAGSRDLRGFTCFCLNQLSYHPKYVHIALRLRAAKLLRYSRTPVKGVKGFLLCGSCTIIKICMVMQHSVGLINET